MVELRIKEPVPRSLAQPWGFTMVLQVPQPLQPSSLMWEGSGPGGRKETLHQTEKDMGNSNRPHCKML